jgi:hypothetical protein
MRIRLWTRFLFIFACPSSKQHVMVITLCILQHTCALIYQLHKTIIEDNKLVCKQSTKYFTISMNNHYSNIDIDIIDHGKIIDCTTHHVYQENIVGMMRKCCRWWWISASQRGTGGIPEAPTEAAVKGSAPPPAAQGAPTMAGPRGALPPCPPYSLYLLGAVEEPSPLEMAVKREAIS